MSDNDNGYSRMLFDLAKHITTLSAVVIAACAAGYVQNYPRQSYLGNRWVLESLLICFFASVVLGSLAMACATHLNAIRNTKWGRSFALMTLSVFIGGLMTLFLGFYLLATSITLNLPTPVW
jgi:hypothetical protein